MRQLRIMRINRTLRPLLALLLALFLQLGLSTAALATWYEAEEQVVRVGVFDFMGYYGTDEQGVGRGYGYSYLEELAKYTDVRYEYVHGSWAECLQMLERGEIDILDTAQKTPERAEKFLFCDSATGRSIAMLTVREDNAAVAFHDFAAFSGMRIGQLEGNSRNADLAAFALENAFVYEAVNFLDTESMQTALQNGEIDAILTSSLRDTDGEKVVARFAPSPFYIMVNPARPDLQKEFNAALEQLGIYKPDFSQELESEHFWKKSVSAALTRDEMDFIKYAPPIRVVYDSHWPPFEHYDAKRGVPAGLNVDIFHQVSDETGLEFAFLHGYSYDEALALVSRHEADMLLSYDTNPEKASDLGIRISNTFLETPIAIIGRDYGVGEDSVFAISDMHPLALAYITEHFPRSRILHFPSIEDCYRAVQTGEADFTTENIYAAIAAIEDGSYGDLIIASVTTLKDRFSFAFDGQSDRRLISIFNKFIASMSVEEKETLLLTYSANLGAASGVEMLVKRYSMEILAGTTILFVFLALCLVMIVLQQKKNRRRLWEVAYIDNLTGLPNRNLLLKRMDEHLQEQSGQYHLLLQLDINKFTLINELYGFEEGDRVLCAVCTALTESIDQSRDLLARTHGDHFVVLLHCKNPEEAEAVFAESFNIFYKHLAEETPHKVHFALGRCLIPPGETEVELILEKVNYAHNTAKRMGLLNIPYDYDDATKKRAIRHREIEGKMDAALQNRDFRVYLQPKYELKGRRMVGAEALVRWQNFDGDGMLSPIEFIPLFEKNGFVKRLDFYMFRRCCEILKQWQEQGRELLSLSVNFSRMHLQNPDFVEQLCAIANELGVPHGALEIELTESAALEQEEELELLIRRLHEEGFAFAMDDFGAGYSSLGLLKNMPVDTLKIDRSFFENSNSLRRARIVLENVIRMATELGIRTVAEGVETRGDVELLMEIGCEVVQGYYFARPLPLEEFCALPQSYEEKSTVR